MILVWIYFSESLQPVTERVGNLSKTYLKFQPCTQGIFDCDTRKNTLRSMKERKIEKGDIYTKGTYSIMLCPGQKICYISSKTITINTIEIVA